MKQYYLRIQSKNEKSLKNFLHFFFEHLNTKFSIIKKSSASKVNRKVITFLKSPHVNKTAQDHFETNLFTKKVLVKEFFLEKNLIFLKKILNKLFQDISISLELLIHEKITKKNNFSIFNPNNVKLLRKKMLKKNLKRYKQKIILKKLTNEKSFLIHLLKFLKITSVFGEILISFAKKNSK